MELVKVVDPGKQGEINELRWLDDQRLMLSVNVIDTDFGVSFFEPTLIIIRTDSRDTFTLPANFLATIDEDPDHLLVVTCARKERDECLGEIRRLDVDKTSRGLANWSSPPPISIRS